MVYLFTHQHYLLLSQNYGDLRYREIVVMQLCCHKNKQPEN